MTLTMLLSFTGYLLPWDQLAIWAVTVGSNMARATPFLGNEGPGAALLAIGDINLVHVGSDVRFALLGGRFVGEASPTNLPPNRANLTSEPTCTRLMSPIASNAAPGPSLPRNGVALAIFDPTVTAHIAN